MFAWMRDKIRRLSSPEDLQAIDAEGISQYLPDEIEDSEKGQPTKIEELNDEPAPVIDMRIRTTPKQTVARYDAQAAADEEQGDTEGTAAGVAGGGGDKKESKGGGATGGDGGGKGGTGTSGGGTVSMGPDYTKRIDLTNLRIYCSDPTKGRYRLLFEPKTENAAHLRVFVIGEVGIEPAELVSYSVNGGPDIPLGNSKGLINPLTLKKAKNRARRSTFARGSAILRRYGQTGGVTIIDALEEPDLRDPVSEKIEQLTTA